MPTILDSNVWIAYLDQNDSQHKKAVGIFERQHDSIILPEQILFEIVTVLHLKVGADHAKKFLELVLDNEEIEITHFDQRSNLFLLRFFQETAHSKLSLVDHLLLLLSREYEIITLDRALEKAIRSSAKK